MNRRTFLRPRRVRAFTVVELLVVIVIIALLALIAIPAFRSMLYSAEESLAQTRLTQALRVGRDAAMGSSGKEDAAVVFFYDPSVQRTSLVTCVRVGEVEDHFAQDNTRTVRRDVFVPVATLPPVQLPPGWAVNGYAAPNTINAAWYEPVSNTPRYENPDPDEAQSARWWVFPETDFLNIQQPDRNEDGYYRQTFMIRFKAGTGEVVTAPADPAIVLAPLRSTNWRANDTFQSQDWVRPDLADDYRRYATRILMSPQVGDLAGSANNIDDVLEARRELLGDRSPDTVLARPVGQIALYDLNELIRDLARAQGATGVRLDRKTGSLYDGNATEPRLLTFGGSGLGSQDDVARVVNIWIEGNTSFPQNTPIDRDDGDIPKARIYFMDRFTGEARPLEVEL